MKKLLAIAFIGIGVLFSACNSAKPNKAGWYEDYAEAKKIAQKQNKNILLFVSSSDEEDKRSSLLKSNIFNTDEFKKFAKENSLVCVNLNFSQEEYKKSLVGEDAPKKEKEDAKKIQESYEYKFKVTTWYNINETPSLFLTTNEGYPIAKLKCNETIIKFDDFALLIENEAPKIEKCKKLFADIKNSNNLEKAKAIDALYEETSAEYRFLIANQIEEFLTLDSKNETGLLGKFLLASANIDAQNAFFAYDPEKAISSFDKVIKSEFTTADEKQLAYYMSAYMLIQTGSQDIDRLIDLYQKSYDANPNSNVAAQILLTISSAKEMRDEQLKQAENFKQQ